MTQDILGVLLAGGQSLRMGHADKFLLRHRDRTLLQHCVELAKPQVNQLVISANGDPTRLEAYGLPVIPDFWPDHPGPLAGIISVMVWAQKARKDYAWLASFATDTPYFPQDLVNRLRSRAESDNAKVAFAATDPDNHYTFALWSADALAELMSRFNHGERSLHRVATALGASREVFSANDRTFLNVNTPSEWQALTQLQN